MASVYKYYDIPKNREGNCKAKCKECGELRSFTKGVSPNLLKHLKRAHPSLEIHKAVKEDQVILTSFVKCTKKYSTTDPRYVKITNSHVRFIARAMVPLATVEDPDFVEYSYNMDPKYQVPSRKHLSGTLLNEKCLEVEKRIKQLLSNNKSSVCTTLDLWSSYQMRSYFGITIHFITDWVLHNAMLSCKRFKGSHTADRISEEYEESVSHFGINDKLLCSITDNAANMIAAFSLPGFTTSIDEDDDDDDLISDTSDNTMEEVAISSERYSCFAHTTQLVVKDGLKEAGPLSKVLSKTSNIVSSVRKSTIATEILEDEKRLQSSNATRWNSQVKMIRSVLAVPEHKLRDIEKLPILTAHDRNLLNDMLAILVPFEQATDYAQIQNSVSASGVIPCILGLECQMNQMSSRFNCKMLNALKQSVQKRLKPYVSIKCYRLASSLDPRFKLLWCKHATDRSAIKEEMKAEVSLHALSASTVTSSSGISPPAKKGKYSDLFSFMTVTEVSANIGSTAIDSEIQSYFDEAVLPQSTDVLAYWKVNSPKYPHLAKLAEKYLAIPASSAPVERIFSFAGKVFRPDRCSLKDETFEKLMFLKCNM